MFEALHAISLSLVVCNYSLQESATNVQSALDPLEPVPISTSPIQSPSKSLVTVLGTGPTVPMGQDMVQVNPPGLDDYSSDDASDDDARPFTREELKARTATRMQRQPSKEKSKSCAHSNFVDASNTFG